jgi:hypothetical protein
LVLQRRVAPMLMWAETPTLPVHKVYIILLLLFLCVLLVLGMACHGMA